MKAYSVVLLIGSAGDPMDRLAATLRTHGIIVRVTTSGAEGLAAIRTHHPAVVVLQLNLPDMDGLDILRRISGQEGNRSIPVLFIADDTPRDSEAFRLGAADVIPPAWRSDEVVARIRTYIELGSLRVAARRESVLRAAAAQPPPFACGNGWISVAMQTGRMFGFDWDARTDEVVRSQSCTQVLAASDAARDTGANWFRRVHPDDVERLRGVLSILSPAYDAYDTKYRVQRSDGQWITIQESSRGFFDSSKRLIRVTGVVVDVSEQVKAERALAAMQSDLLSLVEKIPIAVALTNEHGTIEYINESFTRTFGYRLEEIAYAGDWWRLAYPDEHYRRDVIAAWEHAVRRAESGTHDIPPGEYLITGKDGSRHTVKVFGAVLGHRKLVLFDDITERKRAEAELRESEERFRLMADTAPIMLWMSGVDKQCTFFNRGWLEFTGRTLVQELGAGWADSVHPDDLKRCLETYSEAFDARRRFQMEYRLRQANGEYGCVLDTGVPRFDSNGSFAGYIGSCLDISEFKRQQEHMLAMQRLESLGVIASGIAHDFNNLMGCIIVDVGETVSELEPGSRARTGLRRIEAVAVRASEIVRQIMAYAGKGRQGMEPVDLCAVVREMLGLLQVCLPKNVRLDLRLANDLPLIKASAPQIRQVVMNLVLNAAEAFGQREGTIQVTVSRSRFEEVARRSAPADFDGGEWVCLAISDNGLGMTEEVRNRIFDPFFSTKLEGRGLGLPAVQRIVRSHGGSIRVDSTPGVGTTFEIWLPSTEASSLPAPSPDQIAADASRPRNAAVLIVEDEETLRLSVSQMLRSRGLTVLEAADGNAAINLIHSQGAEIGVLLLDVTLPGKSSLEVLELLQRVRPDARVILTSAFEWENVEGKLRGVRHNFIRKPYHLNELISLIRHALPPPAAGAGLQGHQASG